VTAPSSLLQSGVYRLPPSLVAAYRDELTQRGLLERARAGSDHPGLYGGEGLAETEDHFACRFQTSASRPEHLILATSHQYESLQANLLSALASHHVALLDLGCGTGAGTLSLLGLLVELRRENHVPSLPLNIDVLGADFSESARDIFSSMCARMGAELARAGILLTFRAVHWDGRCSETTSALCDDWLQTTTANEYLLIVNNLSGHGRAMHKDLEDSWKHIGDRLHSAKPAKIATWTWLESDSTTGADFLRKIRAFFGAKLERVFPVNRKTSAEKYEWHDSFTGKKVLSSVIIHQYSTVKE